MRNFKVMAIALCAASLSFAGLRVSYHIGGTGSSLGYRFSDSSGISVTDQNARSMLLLGTTAEIDFKETFGVSIGMQLEDRGGTLIGNVVLPFPFGKIDGDLEFKYRYLQVPLQAKLIVPLLIPGSIFLSAGPELGFLIDNSYTIRIKNGSPLLIDIDSLTSKTDFGISGTFGYELPLGRYFALSVWGGYYYGFTDLYENKSKPSADFDLFNRAIRFGVSFTTTVKEF
jgi:hypothetical protein